MFFTGENTLEDPFEEYPDEKLLGDLGLLVGLIGVKMMIINGIEKGQKSFHAFQELLEGAPKGSAARRLLEPQNSPIMDTIGSYVVGMSKELQKKQYLLLYKYMERAKANNKTILPALLNPAPLMSQVEPTRFLKGSVEEARVTLECSWLFFQVCPGAGKRIKQFLQSDELKYDHVIPASYFTDFYGHVPFPGSSKKVTKNF